MWARDTRRRSSTLRSRAGRSTPSRPTSRACPTCWARALIFDGSPRFSSEDKGKGLAAIAERGQVQPLTVKFLGLLAANRRTNALVEITAAFQRLAAARRGLVSAQVTTAVPLSDAQTNALKSALRQAIGKDPEIEARVDPAILGGVKVRVGSRLYDASLKSRLDSLKYALKRA
jgi:F-type H+-transporting ATPase subunit delta